MNGNKEQKTVLVQFWSRFGKKRFNGSGYSKEEKLSALIELSRLQIHYKRQKEPSVRREQFNAAKHKLHPWRRFGSCFACGANATARHHIIQLQNGGINSKKNLVSLCDACHAEIHPWLSS